MSKLEEARGIRNYIDGKGTFHKDVEVMDWLIQQVERVEELKKARDTIEFEAHRQWARATNLEIKNQRYKQALEFYADKKSHERPTREHVEGVYIGRSDYRKDRGKKAREALEREE